MQFDPLYTNRDIRAAEAIAFALWLVTGMLAAGMAAWSMHAPVGV